MNDALRVALDRIAAPGGAFAARVRTPSDDLGLRVEGVGEIGFPISPAKARALCEVARPARFGLGERTLHDARVRDTWTIAKSRVKIDQRRWKKSLAPRLEEIRVALGLPDGLRLRAELHDLLVYEPGQFFLAHQDSEKSDAMIGTLVVLLPSEFRGGASVIERGGEKLTFRGAPKRGLELLAFYADCRHEVRPITAGYRIALTYDLVVEGEARAVTIPEPDMEALARAVEDHFRAPSSPRWRGGPPGRPPDRLVYLLDHEYTERGLRWEALKSGDGSRVAALREVSRRLDCEIFLALVEVHETWGCEDEGLHYGRGGYDDWYEGEDEGENQGEDEGEDDDGTASAGEPALVDLHESEVQLYHWVGVSGDAPKGIPDVAGEDEVRWTTPSAEFDPFRTEHEGYMGNWGNTVDRWYRRAAVVLWPRDRTFVLRAQVSARWALGEIARTLRSHDVGAARSMVETVLPFWPRVARAETRLRFVDDALRVAGELASPALAAALLDPIALERVTSKAGPRLAALLERYGLEWSRTLLAAWAGRARAPERSAWIVALPELCVALSDASAGARLLARSVAAQQWAWALAEHQRAEGLSSPALASAACMRLAAPILGVLRSAVITESRELGAAVLDYATLSVDTSSVTLGLAILQQAHASVATEELATLGLGPLHVRCTSALAEVLANAPRAADDWAIAPPESCRCELCKQLAVFLAAPDRARFEWPLAKERRSHIHGIVSAHDLPVTHVTRRTGRPYVLVLTKTAELFEREAREREERRREISWLAQTERSFGPRSLEE